MIDKNLVRTNNPENTIIIQSWGDFSDQVLQPGDVDTGLRRFRPSYVFRGLPSVSFDLESSLYRLTPDNNHRRAVEKHLLRNFRKYGGHQISVERDALWNWISVAQHFGLPTRLLDWTFSPYIALHFALSKLQDPVKNDYAAIWQVDYGKTNQTLPPGLERILSQKNSWLFTVEMLNDATKGTVIDKSFGTLLQEFDDLGGKEGFVVFFEPPTLDARIQNQYALFSVTPDPDVVFNHWLDKQNDLKDCYKVFLIHKDLQWEFRDKLDRANINERMLFPGPAGLSQWLKRYYGPPGLKAADAPEGETIE